MNRLELTAKDFPLTHEVLRQAVNDGVAPGFVAGLWQARRPRECQVTAIGQRRIIPSPQPLGADTVFDLASVTKVFATATLAACLVERRWIDWSTPLRALLPNYPHAGEIEIKHLLSHTAGLVWWKPMYEELQARFAPRKLHEIPIAERQRAARESVFKLVPQARPGERLEYSDPSFLLLGFALEEVTAMPLDQAVQRFVWDPLEIEGAHYRRVKRDAAAGRDEKIAATEDSEWRGGVLQGQVHDDNCWAMGGYGGHAGAFARAEDVLKLAARLAGPTGDGSRGWLSRETMQAAWSRASAPVGCERTLGWDTPSDVGSSAGRRFSPLATVGHVGFTGTSLWIDRAAGLAVTLLSNRVHPSRENVKIRELRPRFHDAIRDDLSHHV